MLKKKTDGTLIVDIYGDPPLTLTLNLSLDELLTRKQIVLTVTKGNSLGIVEADLPQ